MSDQSSLGRLLHRKKTLGLHSACTAASPNATSEIENPGGCISCGYHIQGQIVDRCPECGLQLVSGYRDPTTWSSQPSWKTWLECAFKILSWDDRTLTRTALVPTTPESRSFAKRSILLTSIPLGIAIALINRHGGNSVPLALVFSLITTVLGTLLAGTFLAGLLWAVCMALNGVWRRRLEFVPAAVHYSSAWWPIIGVLLCLMASLFRLLGTPEVAMLSIALGLVGAGAWFTWLWASASLSQHVRFIFPRLLGTALGFSVLAAWIIILVPGSAQLAMQRILNPKNAAVNPIATMSALSANPLPKGPQTYSLIIDMIPSRSEPRMVDCFEKMGVAKSNQFILRHKQGSLETIRRAFSLLREGIREQDKFIFYINGHGSKYGSGSIKVYDGEFTSQMLGEYLSRLPAKNNLLIIDSCYGGKFITALRDKCDAVVLASTDRDNIAFNSALDSLWPEMERAENDQNGDGKIAINEAFWSVYRKMLKSGEDARISLLLQNYGDKRMRETILNDGLASPQLETLGEAEEDQFAIELPDEE